jgi:putative two-component system response regulator
MSEHPMHEASIVSRKQPLVLIVDDEAGIRALLKRLLTGDGYAVEAAEDGESALAAVMSRLPDVVLLDINIPGLNGIEVCRRVRQDATTRLTPVIFITGLEARELRVEGLKAGADDFLTKPVDPQELLARVRSLTRLKKYTDDLDSASAIIVTLATMIEMRDGYGDGHCHRMANYATRLGRAVNVGDSELQALHRGGFLHDIGMLAISDFVLRKTGPLASVEYEQVKSHTVIGDQLCSNLRSLQTVRPIVRSHHERLDGSGYPEGLRGDEIPLSAQIIGVVDVFDAVTTDAPYQPAQSTKQAIEVLRSDVARGWRRKDLVETFVQVIQQVAPQ